MKAGVETESAVSSSDRTTKERIQSALAALSTGGVYARASESPAPIESFSARDLAGALINADNLSFLEEHQDLLQGAVRMVYIDPPYNTGNPSQLYHDRFDRIEWLAFMRRRLELTLPLLAGNGSLLVSIDDREMPHLRLLLDELLGEDSMVACIAYERSGSAGLGQSGTIVNTKEYILFYSKERASLNELSHDRPLEPRTMKRYNKVLVCEGERELLEEIEYSHQTPARLYRHENFEIESISLRDPELRKSEIEERYVADFERVFRTQNVQKENSFQTSIISRLSKGHLYSLDYVPTRGRYRGSHKRLYYWNRELCAWLKDSSTLVNGSILKSNKLTDFWPHSEIPKADLANEGGVNFKRGKKPEHLLHRLISMTTEPGELVLDYFAGSGTTCAVAHKTGRTWIGVEHADYFDECTLRRLKNVLDGDSSGVSKLCDFNGGGIFGIAK